MNQITHAAFVAAFVAKHGCHPDAFKMEKRGDAWKAKMEVLDSLAQVPQNNNYDEGGSVRGCYPTSGLRFSVPTEQPYRAPCLRMTNVNWPDPGAIGADSIVAFANHNHAFATEV